MAKEEVKKEKKSKSKGAAAKASTAPAPAPDARVLAAVAAFLESSGLPLTLAALQSEANLEGDAWRSSPVSLEDAVSKLLESSASAPGADIAAGNEQEKTDDAAAEEKGAGKKKKSKKVVVEAHEPESKASEPSAPEKPSEKVDDETKEKKRKKKKDSSSAGDDGEANAVVKTDDQKTDGKKRKSKKQENDEDVEARLEKVELAVKAKFEAAGKLKADDKKSGEDEPKSQIDEAEKSVLCDGAPLDKGKKKKSKSTSETSDRVDAGTAPTEVEVKSNGASENGDAVGEGKDVNEKKSKKKKRKSGSEENGLVEDKQVAGKDSALKPDDENKTAMDIENGEDGKASADDAVVSKKRKLEEVEGSKPPAKEDITATEDDVKEPSTTSNKRQKLSEPKSAFQRVKAEDIKFADERLQDNSYWAKGGADSGYGAKAQEILGEVRGRDFRHEKTKKKRGTYKGGFIDLQTHSIKFNNSDDE